jgi:uncharacterized membrane protein
MTGDEPRVDPPRAEELPRAEEPPRAGPPPAGPPPAEESPRAEDPPRAEPPPAEESARDSGLERLVFFSDAVFAIAITLLVIDLRLPDIGEHASNDALVDALRAIGPRIAAYALSFAVIGLYWLAHWRRYHYIVRADQRLALINLVLLGFVAFIPFPTAVMGEHGDLPAALILYVTTLTVAGLIGPATLVYASRNGLVAAGTPREVVRYGIVRGLGVPIVMAASLALLPFVSTNVIELTWLLTLVVQPVLSRRFRPAEGIAAGL